MLDVNAVDAVDVAATEFQAPVEAIPHANPITVDLFNNMFDGVRDELALPKDLKYDGDRTRSADIRKAIEGKVPEKASPQLNRLLVDLEYFDLLEKGGLDEVNKYTAELVRSLSSGDAETRRAGQSRLNDIMQRAVFLLPHLANNIHLQLDSSAAADVRRGKDNTTGNRHIFESLINLAPETARELRIPLPYAFDTGTHGSGQRQANDLSRNTIAVENSVSKGRPETLIGVGLLARRAAQTYFKPHEIASISFDRTDEYSPRVDDYEKPDRLHLPSDVEGPIGEYLGFRGFVRSRDNSAWLVPRAGNALSIEPGTNRPIGYIVEFGSDGIPSMHVLPGAETYMDGVTSSAMKRIRNISQGGVRAAIAAIATLGRQGHTTYSGNEIVRKLATTPQSGFI